MIMVKIGRALKASFRRGEAAGQGTIATAAKWAILVILALSPIGLLSVFAFRTATRVVSELVEASNLAAATVAADIARADLERSLQLSRSIAESRRFIADVEARDEESARSRLKATVLLHGAMSRAFVHDVDGVLWTDYPKAEESLGRDFSDRDWYRGVSRDWKPYVSEVYLRNAAPREMALAATVPIRDEEGNVIGILVTQYLLKYFGLNERLSHVRLGDNGRVFLLDPAGRVAAHPELTFGGEFYDEYIALDPVQQALRGMSHTGEYNGPVTGQRKVGTFLPVTISGRGWVIVAEQPAAEAYAPIRRIAWNIGAAGIILALVAVSVVVTLWRIGEHNRRLSERLERKNRVLQKTTTELERSNKALEEFAYVASHDLQEPLRMVSSYTQLLGRRYQGKLDEAADKYIFYAVDGAKRMQALIQDLLKYSRVGTQGKPFEPTDFSKALQQALTYLKIAIREEEAEVTFEPLPTLMADPTQITQLFQNLVGNAIKFRKEEPPRVDISARQENQDWVFSIRDNGIGIAPQYGERIFLIFHRLPSKKPVSGTGLGLSVCKKIVERHGGRIWVESKEGEGSTFRFTIPVNGNKVD